MPMDGQADIRSCNWGRTEMCHLTATGWQSPPDATNNRMVDKGQVVVPAQALELMSGHGAHRRPPAR